MPVNDVDMSKIPMSAGARAGVSVPTIVNNSDTGHISIFEKVKEYGGAAINGCVLSSSIALEAAGTATLVTGGAAALPSAGATAITCASGALGGMLVYWIDPPYDLSPMQDAYDGKVAYVVYDIRKVEIWIFLALFYSSLPE